MVLENPENTDIGDLKGLNSNARVMVKMALFSAWARLQIASTEQDYLIEVVKPYLARLTPLWLSSLQEYARLRFEPDISGSLGTGPQSNDLDEVYSALNRETLLKVIPLIAMLIAQLTCVVLPRFMVESRGCNCRSR